MKKIAGITLLLIMGVTDLFPQTSDTPLPSKVVIVQPVIVRDNDGKNPAWADAPEKMIEKILRYAGPELFLLQTRFYDNIQVRDGNRSLNEIHTAARAAGILLPRNDILHVFFVRAIEKSRKPLIRCIENSNVVFVSLCKEKVSVPGCTVDSIVPPQLEAILLSLSRDRVRLLSKKEGRSSILDESFEPYFSQLQKNEIKAFTGHSIENLELGKARIFAREKFATAVLEFTEKEKYCLTEVIAAINRILVKNNQAFIARHPWQIIKVEDWLCGGFAHTRGMAIILSSKRIGNLTSGWKEGMTESELNALILRSGAVLVHEQIHVLQKTFPDLFKKLYTDYWNFVHAAIKTNDPSIDLNQVSNPDAIQPEWLIPDQTEKNHFFWIRTLLREHVAMPKMGVDFRDVVFHVYLKDGKYELKRDKENKVISYPVSALTDHVDAFPVTRGIDHPNEITAYMYTDFFKSCIEDENYRKNVKPQALSNVNKFLAWMNDEMNKPAVYKK